MALDDLSRLRTPVPSIPEGTPTQSGLDEWTRQYGLLKRTFEDRARRSARLAYFILVVICILLSGAAIVFLIPQQFSATSTTDAGAVSNEIAKKLNPLHKQLDAKLGPIQRNHDKLESALFGLQHSYPSITSADTTVSFDKFEHYSSKETILRILEPALDVRPASSDVRIKVSIFMPKPPDSDSGSSGTGSGSSGIIDHNGLVNLISKVNQTDFEDTTPNVDDIALLARQIGALESVKSTADQIQNEQDASKILGEKVSYITNLAMQQPRDVFGVIEPNITRFGTMIIVSFLVSILVPLYRYNIRLAAFYQARADGLAWISHPT
jgi:hypothetical protein